MNIKVFDKIIADPWEHVHVKQSLDINLCTQISRWVRRFDLNRIPTEDKQDGIITGPVCQGDVPEMDFVFDENFHNQVFNFWNTSTSLGYSFNVVWDWCNNIGSNGWHCDLGNSKDTCDVITLQWYLYQPNPKRNLILKGISQDHHVDTQSGSFVMFKSYPHTNHMFCAGEGERLSLRLRLKTHLISPLHVHCPESADKIGVIIDCKKMDVDGVPNIEHNLGNFTFINLKKHNWKNIVVIDDHTQFSTAQKTLLSQGCDQILVLFAGAIVSSHTKELVTSFKNQCVAHMNNEKVFRKYLLIHKNISDTINQQNFYANNIMHQIVNKHNHELGIYYVHPEQKTLKFLNKIQKFMLPEKENIDHPEADVYTDWINQAQKPYF